MVQYLCEVSVLYKQDLLAVVILEIGKVLQADFHLAAILIHLESEVCFEQFRPYSNTAIIMARAYLT